MAHKVFLSLGRPHTQQQEDFVSSLEEFMRSNDLIPQTVGRTYFSSLQPLKAVAELMDQCFGTIILAYERTQIVQAVEKRGSKDERTFSDITLSTVWNQIEGSMAYTRGHPLLVIIEENIKEEGLLERGYDWYVKKVRLSREGLYDREFMGVFNDWKRRVEEFADAHAVAGSPQVKEQVNPSISQSASIPTAKPEISAPDIRAKGKDQP